MADMIVVNEIVDEMYAGWAWGWIRCDANNSFEEPADFTNKADFDAFWQEVEGRGECVSFYRCPICGGVSNNPLAHVLDSHREATRVWQSRDGQCYSVYLPGEGGHDPLRRVGADSRAAEVLRRWLKKEATFAELREAVA